MKGSKQLLYDIMDSHKNFGEGNIYSIINSKQGYWRSLIQCPQTVIKCCLQYCSQISLIQIEIEDVDMIEFKGYQNNELIFRQKKVTSQQQKDGQLKAKHILTQKCYTTEIQIYLYNHNDRKMAIKNLTFYGNVDYSKPNDNYKKDKREKKKVRQLQDQPYKFIFKSKLEDKLQSNQQKKQQNQNKLFDINDLEDKLQIRQPTNCISNQHIKITKKNKNQLTSIFNGISQKWLQAQKIAQFSECIPTEYQISVLINPKCFSRKIFCILNVTQDLKRQLITSIKQLGGFIRQQPCQNCYIITPILVGSNVQYAKSLKNIKFVTPQYISDCFRVKSLLGIKKYHPK